MNNEERKVIELETGWSLVQKTRHHHGEESAGGEAGGRFSPTAVQLRGIYASILYTYNPKLIDQLRHIDAFLI